MNEVKRDEDKKEASTQLSRGSQAKRNDVISDFFSRAENRWGLPVLLCEYELNGEQRARMLSGNMAKAAWAIYLSKDKGISNLRAAQNYDIGYFVNLVSRLRKLGLPISGKDNSFINKYGSEIPFTEYYFDNDFSLLGYED